MNTKDGATRRRFFRQAGAVLSAPLAVGAAQAAVSDAEDGESLKARLARLDAINAIRELNQAFARHINTGESDSARQLFADPRGAILDENIRKLTASDFGERDLIEFSADGRSARTAIHCEVQTETEIGPNCTLVEMARQQGDGVLRQTEQRLLENECIKQDGVWKILKSGYRPV